MMTAEQWLDAQANQCVVIGEFRTSDGCFVLVDENREPIPIPKLAITRMLEAYHRAEAAAQLAEKEREIERITRERDNEREAIEKSATLLLPLVDTRDGSLVSLAENAAAEIVALRTRAEAAEQRLQEAQAEITRLHKLFCDLTPGGSEFAGDPDYCAEYLRDRSNTQTDLLKKKFIELRQREAELEQRDGKIGRAYEVAHEHARTKPHETVPVQVWADIDTGIADLVRYLNTIDGVRTDASCQGTKGYSPYVMATWNAETDARLRAEFEIETLGENWGYIRVKRVQP